jgi:hypothetical protein
MQQRLLFSKNRVFLKNKVFQVSKLAYFFEAEGNWLIT